MVRKTPSDAFSLAGRAIPRVLSPWIDLQTTFIVGLDYDIHNASRPSADGESSEDSLYERPQIVVDM